MRIRPNRSRPITHSIGQFAAPYHSATKLGLFTPTFCNNRNRKLADVTTALSGSTPVSKRTNPTITLTPHDGRPFRTNT